MLSIAEENENEGKKKKVEKRKTVKKRRKNQIGEKQARSRSKKKGVIKSINRIVNHLISNRHHHYLQAIFRAI